MSMATGGADPTAAAESARIRAARLVETTTRELGHYGPMVNLAVVAVLVMLVPGAYLFVTGQQPLPHLKQGFMIVIGFYVLAFLFYGLVVLQEWYVRAYYRRFLETSKP